jgi:hypothetical protein
VGNEKGREGMRGAGGEMEGVQMGVSPMPLSV